MISDTNLRGYKGGGSSAPRQPVEAPDSLISNEQIRIIDLLGEGEIGGLVNGANSIFLDESPSTSYPSLTWDFRLGTQDQSYMPGFPAVESDTQLNMVIKTDAPLIYAVPNTTVSAVRINFALGRFAKQNPSNGDTNGTRVNYAIDLAEGIGPFKEIKQGAFSGKTTGGYTRSVRVDLTYPAPAGGWRIRVRRITPDATSSAVSDTVSVRSVTEIIDYKFRYPNSAIIGLSFDAESFGGKIPKRAYHIRGLIIKVPSNYDPIARTYAGVWDGTFKQAWTNNPVWIYYDLLLNSRFGLGDRISANQIDKWGLYEISQYCDQMVDDGKGGLEPRFTCNLYLQKQSDALKVLQDIAAIFRGITYWGLGQAIVSADMPRDPVYVYTNANVINGRFDRKGSKKSTIYTVVLSAWNDPNDFYRTKYEYVQDDVLVAKYGVRTMTLTNLGCSSQGQAHRAGKWALISNYRDNNTVTFSVGLEGIKAMPGEVVRVVDQYRQGRRVGGRVRPGSTATVINVDRLPNAAVQPGDELALNLSTGVSEVRPVVSVDTEGGTVQVNPPFSTLPVDGGVWAYEAADLKSELYRIVSVSEGSSPLEYNITALTYTDGKHEAVDTGAIISSRPTVAVPASVVPAPQNVAIVTNWMTEQYQAVTTLTISWDKVVGAVRYDVEWRRDDSGWIYAGRVAPTEVDVKGVYAGIYSARVRAVNAVGILSPWAEIGPEFLDGKVDPPPMPVNPRTTSEIFAIKVEWDFPEGAQDTAFTQMQMSESYDGINPSEMGQLSYPTSAYLHSGMASGVVRYFRLRLIDKSGNVGDWTAWFRGESSAEATEILDYIKGQITETEIGKILLDRIDLIDQTGPGSVNERLETVRGEVTSLQNDLQYQIDNIADLADSAGYKPDQAYVTGQAVFGSDSKIYQAVQDVPVNTPPPNATYWADLGQIVMTADGLAARVSAVETEVTSINGTLAAHSSDITGLQSSLSGKASASALTALETRVISVEGAVTSQSQSITNLSNRLGGLGGENLLPNSSFEEPTSGDSTLARHWSASGTSTTWSLVPSPLAQSTYAQRVVGTAIAPGGAIRLVQVLTGGAPFCKVRVGATYVLSAYVRGKAGTTCEQVIQFFDINNAVIQTNVSVAVPHTESAFSRLVMTAVAPANAATARVFPARTYNTGAAAADLWFEVDNVQLQEGTEATAYTPSVSQTAAVLSEATTALTSRVATVEGTVTTQSSSITSLQNSLTSIQGSMNAFGLDPAPTGLWQFDTTVEGWTASEATLAAGVGFVTITATTTNPNMSSPSALGISGGQYTRIRASITRRGGSGWDGVAYYTTPGHGISSSYRKTVANPNLAIGASAVIEWNMAALTAGGTDWTSNTINQIRIDFGNTASDVFEVNWIAVGRVGVSASSRALTDLSSTVTQQGDSITAQAQQITSLSTTVNGQTASIQQVSTVAADTNNAINAAYSVKLMTTTNGTKVAAGFGLGLGTENGVTQSQFVVSADRFAVLNSTLSGVVTSPFAVVNGQTYIADAYIRDASITNAKIGGVIRSSAVDSYGRPLWSLNKDGSMELNSTSSTYRRDLRANYDRYWYVPTNVLVIEIGELS